jgi:hypothetical protein
MKSKVVFFGLAAAALLALTQRATAQGTSGGTGAIASIPGSIVRGHEQGPGLISIIAGSNLNQKRRTARPGEAEELPKQKTGK